MSRLEIETDAEGIRLRPADRGTPSPRRQRGMPIHCGDGQLAEFDIAEFIRAQR